MTTSKLPVLINREGGAASRAGHALPDRVQKAFAHAGGGAEVQMLAAVEMPDAISRAAKDNDRIVVAGGDGTIAAAAQALAGSDAELAILPLGTLNHFAHDLGIPDDLDDAARVAVDGLSHRVDVGEVNGRRFVNNASVGLYPFLVKNRDDIRERHGLPKWLAMAPAAMAALSRLRHHRLRIDMGDGAEPIVTPLLFVGNNHYSLETGAVGSRASLRDGKLSVYAVSRAGRLALLWFGARAMIGRANRERDFAALGDTEALTVAASRQAMEIARDGEVHRLDLPLRFSILPGALKVVVPPDDQGKA